MKVFKRAFVAVGLLLLAAPGIAAEGLVEWQIIGCGCLAGLIAAAAMAE